MATKSQTYYPTKVHQGEGGAFRTFKDINVIKNMGNGYAESRADILGKSKSPNRPATITADHFNLNLPEGAILNKVTVRFKHSKTGDSNQKSCNIGAPTVTLMYNSKPITVNTHGGNLNLTRTLSKKAQAPKMVSDTTTATFDGKVNEEVVTGTYAGTSTGGTISNVGITVNQKQKTKKIATYYDFPSRAKVNSNSFGVKIDYPANTNDYKGKVRVYWVRIEVQYTTSEYTLQMQEVRNTSEWGYNKEQYHLKLKISRTSKTNYNPTVTLTTPEGFTYKNVRIPDTNMIVNDHSGTVEKISAHVLKYTPALSTKNEVSTSSVELVFDVDCSYPSGGSYDGVFEASESLNSGSASFTAVIRDRPVVKPVSDVDVPVGEIPLVDVPSNPIPRIIAMQGEEFHIETQFSSEEIANAPEEEIRIMPGLWGSYKYFEIKTYNNPDFSISDFSGETPVATARFYLQETPGHTKQIDDDGNLLFTLYSNVVKTRTFQIVSGNTVLRTYDLEVYPKNLDFPTPLILLLSDEEMSRLGDGYSYTLETQLKVVTSHSYVQDWLRNYRIGVFNNFIEGNITTLEEYDEETGTTNTVQIDTTDYTNLTINEILENAEYWSSCPTKPNTYENIELSFMYDEDYPLYIIITGGYLESGRRDSVKFTNPVLVETVDYTGRTTECKFPVPLDNMITGDDTSSITLGQYQQSNNFVLYNLPVDDDFGTNEQYAVRGISITGNVEQSDEVVLYAKLKSPSGEVGQRSIILNERNGTDDDNGFTIGGIGDLWGFGMLDLTHLKDWEFQLHLSNILNDTESTITLNDINIIFYMEEITIQNVNIAVEGEDLSFYNAFIRDLEIPPGLETNIEFASAKGNDRREAVTQELLEKDITIEFDVGGDCSLERSTDSLRQITKLLTTLKDKYGRPIPKRLEFSHMPDVYFEYTMEKSPDVEIELNSYKVKAKLTVPSGTAYAKNNTVTNNIGFIQGLTAVEPIITIVPTGNEIEVTEKRTGQKFQLTNINNYNWTGKIIEIDCEDMIVWLRENTEDTNPTNITGCCDFNNDWFRLYDEYEFEGTGCIIRTVDYTERW